MATFERVKAVAALALLVAFVLAGGHQALEDVDKDK